MRAVDVIYVNFGRTTRTDFTVAIGIRLANHLLDLHMTAKKVTNISILARANTKDTTDTTIVYTELEHSGKET